MATTAAELVEKTAAKAIDYTNADQLIVLVTEHGTSIGMKAVTAIVIFLLGRWLARVVTNIARKTFQRAKMEDTLEKFLCNMLNAVLLVVVIIAAIGALGVQTTSLLAVLGAAGLAVGLALQGSLSNFASGVLIVAFRPYKVGDFIEAAGVAGTVKEVQIFTTVIHSPDNKKILVPNSQIMSGTITNYSANATRRVDLIVGCSYGDDLDQVRALLNDIVAGDERILKDPAPTVEVVALGDNSVNFVVRPWVEAANYWAVHFHIHEQVKKRFDQAGLNIPFPQRDVHLYQHGADR
ncbi:mechanosensitive ion channel domain-containing protein [Candidatus Accumulibacter sp. ACC003]|uniref:mechanosensitive ion channel family protein n=1 Tax=Candidatus Accumulibacter sp. ACC003 TaxID=2823334 RepID=UPI0025C56D58|nr:mechanosensitive ion channel domain-containing protein [Candidatus Accumulibacter sp. ACC003]